MSKQYQIGAFATINKISARMLRHYDKIGLFRPDSVSENGYRCYSSAQIPTLSLIQTYQSCGFTLAEIPRLLSADEGVLALLAKEKRQQLLQRGVENELALRGLLELSQNKSQAFPNDYPVSYTRQPDRLLLSCLSPVAESKIDEAFEQLYTAVEHEKITPIGLSMLLSGIGEDGTYRVAMPVAQEVVLNGFDCIVLPGGWYLSTIHHGSYENLVFAYDILLCHLQAENKTMTPPFVERYFLDSTHSLIPSEYITELSVKITP